MEILHGAIRQYRHNDDDGFVFGYDKDETERVVSELVSRHETLIERLEGEVENLRRQHWEEKLTGDTVLSTAARLQRIIDRAKAREGAKDETRK